jgi:flagellar motility protein MotE (MotC chaperone)
MENVKYPVYIIVVAVILFLAVGFGTGNIPLPFDTLVYAQEKEEAADASEDEGGEGAEEGELPCPECPECPDPAKVVLRGLEEKKQAIAAAGEALDQERKELETYASQIDEKLESLAALKKQINDDMARLEQKKSQGELEKEAVFEAKMNRLVKMYAGMKPKAAAQIVDQMELAVAQEIFLRMREASASQILSFVSSEKAAKISERLAFKKE